MIIENVSSVVRTEGSDWDFAVWLGDRAWGLISRLAGSKVQDNQVRVSFTLGRLEVDAYLVPESNPGKYTVAAVESARIQRTWDIGARRLYARKKASLAHLTGQARKLAKVELNEQFDLPTLQYAHSIAP